jgi:hypothetical protein
MPFYWTADRCLSRLLEGSHRTARLRSLICVVASGDRLPLDAATLLAGRRSKPMSRIEAVALPPRPSLTWALP